MGYRYLIDGDVKLTQSAAILRYLARKHKLDGTNEAEKQRIDLVGEQLVDLRMGFVRLCYAPDHDQLKPDFLKNLPNQLKAFSDFLGSNKFFAGANLSFIDFSIYEILDQLRMFSPSSFNGTPNLKQFLDRIEALPNIAKYMSSDKYIKWPLNGDMAKFGSRHTAQP